MTGAPSALVAILAAAYRDEFGDQLLREKIRGKGGNEFLGVLESPATIEVAKEGGQAADTILAGNIQGMSKRCWGYDRAIWVASPDTRAQLTQCAVLIEGATGGGVVPLFRPAQRDVNRTGADLPWPLGPGLKWLVTTSPPSPQDLAPASVRICRRDKPRE